MTEGDQNAQAAIFTVTRTGDTSQRITPQLEVTQEGGFLYEADLGSQVTSLVQGTTEASFFRAIDNDGIDEENGSVTVTIKPGVPGENPYTIGTPSSATITIVDNDDVPDAPVLSARPDNGEIEITWPKPGRGTSNITRYDYRTSIDTGANWSDWTDTEVDVTDTELSLTIKNLINGTPYTVQIRALSDAGKSLPSNTPTVTPSTGPTITAIDILSTPSLCGGRAYADTDEVQIGVTFSEAVTVDTMDGEPYLSLRMEGYDAPAAYKEGSGTTQLVFAKTIVNTDFSGLGGKSVAVDDPANHSTRGLQLNGGTIRSATMINAVLTGTSLARSDNAHMIGTIMTGATLTSSPASGDTYAIGERLTLTADFNRNFGTNNIGNSKLAVAFDSGRREADYSHWANNKLHYGYTIVECYGRCEVVVDRSV